MDGSLSSLCFSKTLVRWKIHNLWSLMQWQNIELEYFCLFKDGVWKSSKPFPRASKCYLIQVSTRIYSPFITHKCLHHNVRSKRKGLIDLTWMTWNRLLPGSRRRCLHSQSATKCKSSVWDLCIWKYLIYDINVYFPWRGARLRNEYSRWARLLAFCVVVIYVVKIGDLVDGAHNKKSCSKFSKDNSKNISRYRSIYSNASISLSCLTISIVTYGVLPLLLPHQTLHLFLVFLCHYHVEWFRKL